jgi:sugar/nucleoside kinase (ribokinase family)
VKRSSTLFRAATGSSGRGRGAAVQHGSSACPAATPTAFLGLLNTDVFGHQLADLLGADGADLLQASFGSVPTTLAVAEVNSDGLAAYRFVFKETSAPKLTPAMVPPSLSPDVNALHVGTLGLVLEPRASTLADFIQREVSSGW